jgi:hypothetical protein
MQPPEPPFPLSPEIRLRTVEALHKLLGSDSPAVVLRAAEIVLVMDQINLAAEQARPALPRNSDN